MKPSLPPRMRTGFTLVELLVVIAIIGLLAAFLFPAIRGAMREAQASKCRKHIQQVVAGMLQYKDDNDQFFPGTTLLEDAGTAKKGLAGGAKGAGDLALDNGRALYATVKDAEVFQCPSDRGSVSPPADNTDFFIEFGSSYIYAGTDGAGILGMKGDAAKGRKYTDPYLAASSLKALFYEPTFFGSAGKPTSSRALWHDSNRASIIGFLDGHAERIRVDANTKIYGAGATSGATAKVDLDKLMQDKRQYY